jgi:ADP-ribose pyrophosphatase YjhB (NUDIX family)
MNIRACSLFRHPPPFAFRLFGRLPRRARRLFFSLRARKISIGVSAIILDEQERILLVRHTYRQPAWDYPSGLVDVDEQPDAAIEREIAEELGVRATVGQLVHAENHRGRRHMTLYYRVFLHGSPRHNGAEIDACRYVSFDELRSLRGGQVPAWLVSAPRELSAGGASD